MFNLNKNMANKVYPCRLCGNKGKEYIKIFSQEAVELSMKSILFEHFSLEFSESKTENESKIVCKKCWKITSDFHQLYCIVKDEILTRVNQDQKSSIQFEPIQSTDYYHEPPGPDNQFDFINIEVKLETFDDSTVQDDQQVGSPQPSKLQSKLATKRKSQQEFDEIDNFESEFEDDTRQLMTRKLQEKELEIIEWRDEEIRNSLGIICELCDENCQTFADLQKHFKNKHHLVGYLRCCERKYTSRLLLYNHIKNHNNPPPKCAICDKIFLDYCNLQAHMKIHDTTIKNIKCPHCPKLYSTKCNLNKHVKWTHLTGPTLFICDICEKSFITKMKIASHIMTVHVQTSQICDVCAKPYRSIKHLNTHYEKIHLGIKLPKVQCKLCSAWLMNEESLRKHLGYHKAKRETCPICGKESVNRNALYSHIRNIHSAERFPCTLCDRKYKKRKSLTDHMSIHTGYSLYKCKYCPMEFNYGSAFYKHRKDVHFIQFEKDRRHLENQVKQ